MGESSRGYGLSKDRNRSSRGRMVDLPRESVNAAAVFAPGAPIAILGDTMKRIIWWSIAAALVVAQISPVLPVAAAGTLIKLAGNSAVYFLDAQGVRHAFPNVQTFRSWYGNDFSAVQTVAAVILAGYPLGRNLTMKPGTALLKVPSVPTVYAVEQGGVL